MNKIFITVDVECHELAKRNLYLEGKIGNEYWGLEKILQIGKEKNVPINFFLDVVECHAYGDEYVKEIVDQIHAYGQKVYFHIHPNFIIPDGYHLFWQYSLEEQKELLRQGISDYERLTGCKCKAMRTGGYCTDQNLYDALNAVTDGSILDVSHCKGYRYSKYNSPMDNGLHFNGKVPVLLNTRYLSFKFFGKKKYANLDIASSQFNEMKRVLEYRELPYLVCSMHSWNLFKQMFYIPWTMRPAKDTCQKMCRFIDLARKKGWEFSDFEESLRETGANVEIDLCKTPWLTLVGWINTFIRMQGAARTSKKYFMVYAAFYAFCVLGIVLITTCLI